MNRKELFMKKRKIATILLAACLLLGNVSVANAASIDNGNKVHFNTEDNDTDLTLLQSKIATEEVTCDFTDATNDGALAGCRPEVMGIGPVYSTKKVLAKTGMDIKDFDIIEANEAFAAQSIAVGRDLGIDVDRQLNPNGGWSFRMPYLSYTSS